MDNILLLIVFLCNIQLGVTILMYSINTFLGICCMSYFYYINNLHLIVLSNIKYFIDIYNSLDKSNIINSTLAMSVIMYEYCKYKLLENLYGTCFVTSTHYGYKYYLRGKIYKFMVPKKVVTTSVDIYHNDVNVTSKLSAYLGPNNDFHELPLTPLMFGYDSLTFKIYDYNGLNADRYVHFKDNEVIKF